jgi:ssDNA-binding Zn-finger/Zn-ribbon topoisomerase 1
MGYTIIQHPCPECGHEHQDMVMEHADLVKNEYVESICAECREKYYKPIVQEEVADELA